MVEGIRYVDGVDFDNNDKYGLDGQRLIRDGNYLRAETDPFTRLSISGDTLNPNYFTVNTKEVLTLYYGFTTDSRIQAQDTSITYLWKLSKVVDNFSNYYSINYSQGSGEAVPSNINFTGFGSIPGDYSVEFNYDGRWPITTYIEGSDVQIDWLLKDITIKYGSSVISKYELIYDEYLDTYRLKEIIKYGKNSSSRLNSTLIDWGTTDSGINETPLTSSGTRLIKLQGDYNGDGRTDAIIVRSSGSSELYFASPTGSLIQQGTFTMPTTDSTKIFPGDFNGDGLSDLIIKRVVSSLAYYKFLISNGNSFTEYNYASSICNSSCPFFTGDFNGNGKTDVLIHKDVGYNCVIHEFSFSGGTVSYSTIGNCDIPWGIEAYTWEREVFCDVNGNGKTDVMIFSSDGTGTFYELQNGSSTMSQISSLSWPPTFNINLLYNLNLFGDFNGDGMTDIYSIDPYNRSYGYIFISKGNSFNFQTSGTFDNFDLDWYNNFYVNDMNGDGKSDLIAVGRGSIITDPVKLFVGYSFGYDLFDLYSYPLSTTLSVDRSYNFFGDYNGDGVDDFYYDDFSVARLINTYRDKYQYLVSEITNGFGYSTTINYASLANSSIYTKGNSSIFPVIDFKGPLYVVSSLALQNPDQTYSTTDYSYSEARIHKQGKGFLGFDKVIQFNNSTSLKSTEEYDYNTTFYNTFIKKANVDFVSEFEGDIAISESDFQNVVTVKSGKWIFPNMNRANQSNYLTGVTAIRNLTFDNLGNLTCQIDTFDDNSYNKTEYKDFCSAGTIANSKPQTIITTKKHYQDSQVFKDTVGITYDQTGAVHTQANSPVTTTYTYDSYGNPTYETASSSSKSRTVHYEYDAKNMFVWKEYNALNQVAVRIYDYPTGNVTQETSPNTNLVTLNKYNHFGQLTSRTLSALGQRDSISYYWATGTRPKGAVYYKKTFRNGAPTVQEYFDAFGRILKTKKTGFDGNDIYSSSVFNNLGQLVEVSTPWKQGETPLKTVFTYDSYGRKTQESSDVGTTNFTYQGKTYSVSSSSGKNSSKTNDSQGNLISSSDNGGTINYTYKSLGKPSSISTNGTTWSIQYDNNGRKTSLTDPDAGTITYTYNGFGELCRQIDSRDTTTFTYDSLSRVKTEIRSEGTRNYNYDPSGKPGVLSSVTYPSGSETLNYDTKSRLTSNVININSTNFTTSYLYDQYSRDSVITNSSGPLNFGIKYIYNNYGYLDQVKRKDNSDMIWDAINMNTYGQLTQYQSGNGLTTTKSYDCLGILRGIATGTFQNNSYSFDKRTGNLTSRKDNVNNLTEIFDYDNLARLTGVSGPVPLSTNFTTNGNIASKTSVGDYAYDDLPHAVSSVTNPVNLISNTQQSITYTSFNKADTILEGPYKYKLYYGCDNQRTMSKLFRNDTLLKTVYYAGDYEKEVVPGTYDKYINYIYGGDGLGAISVVSNGSTSMYYVHKDHLGSIEKITNSLDTVIQSTSFDAWGRRRNSNNWTYYTSLPTLTFSRGYTCHEHLDVFNLINMNGRMYDPILGRFLSPDNYVQAGDFSQSYNRYAYCLNNPLIYIDPSGESFLAFLLGIVIVSSVNYAKNWLDNVINEKMTMKEAFQNTPLLFTYEGTIPYSNTNTPPPNSQLSSSGSYLPDILPDKGLNDSDDQGYFSGGNLGLDRNVINIYPQQSGQTQVNGLYINEYGIYGKGIQLAMSYYPSDNNSYGWQQTVYTNYKDGKIGEFTFNDDFPSTPGWYETNMGFDNKPFTHFYDNPYRNNYPKNFYWQATTSLYRFQVDRNNDLIAKFEWGFYTLNGALKKLPFIWLFPK